MTARHLSLRASPALLEATAFRGQQPSIPALQALIAQRLGSETLRSTSHLLVVDYQRQAPALYQPLRQQTQPRTRLLQQLAWLGYALLVPPGPILALLDTIRKIPLLRSLPSTNVRLVMSTEYAQLWLTVSLVAARVSLVPTTIVKRATSAQSRQRAGSRSLVLQEVGTPHPQVPRSQAQPLVLHVLLALPAQRALGLRHLRLPSRLDQLVARGPTVSQGIIAQAARSMTASLSAQVARTPRAHPLRLATSAQPVQRVHSVHQGHIGPISAQPAITAHSIQSAMRTFHAPLEPTERQKITHMLLASLWHHNAPRVLLATSARAGPSLLSVALSGATCLMPPLRWQTKVTQQLWGCPRTWLAGLALQVILAQSRA